MDRYQPRRPPRHETQKFRGLDHHLIRWGPDSDDPVLVLHGYVDCAASFQFVADEISPELPLCAIDWRGFGGSARNAGGYWFPDYYADLEQFIDTLCPRKPARLVGHSMGANVAMIYAGVRPARVRRLVNLEGFGLPLLEVYGLSETTGVITVSSPDEYRIGRVGRPLADVELRLADDGEILARGANIFRGYRNDPEGTRAAIDDDGWFHTGDIGALDAEGFLKITDRKKELLVTSGGKKVAPAPIEKRLQQILGVGHVVVVGEQRHYVAALVTLDAAAVPKLAARVGSAARNVAEASCCPRVRAFLDREIARVNELLARFESIRRFHVLAGEFSIPGGELTPTMKLKRKPIGTKYAAEIEAMYR